MIHSFAQLRLLFLELPDLLKHLCRLATVGTWWRATARAALTTPGRLRPSLAARHGRSQFQVLSFLQMQPRLRPVVGRQSVPGPEGGNDRALPRPLLPGTPVPGGLHGPKNRKAEAPEGWAYRPERARGYRTGGERRGRA